MTNLAKSGIAAAVLLVAGICFWGAFKPAVRQTRRPLTIQQAETSCPISLPAEATNIMYAEYSDWIVYHCYVRFEVPHEIGLVYARRVFREHAKKMKWSFREPVRVPIQPPVTFDFDPPPELQIAWFDVNQIRNGETFGELNSWQPQVWIDFDRNLFFFCLTD